MLSIISGAMTLLGPIAVFFIKRFIQNKEAKARALKNYYNFISSIDKKSTKKVQNYKAAESALEKLQREIREKNLVEPDRPTERPAEEKAKYQIPSIIYVEIDVKTHGAYLTDSGRAKGLVIHSTAGRFDTGSENAINTLKDMAKRGLGCMVMDIYGAIYLAKSQSLNEIAWHAGKSMFFGYSGLSRYCMGMEICNAGVLDSEGKSWFGQNIVESERRLIGHNNANRKEGVYHKYTAAQEKSLVNFIYWQLDVNPEFSIDWVMGHDECAPDRKSDPGGSLSMTMPEFRDMFKQQR